MSLWGGARASGGAVSPGMGYLVGEHGPEFFQPSSSGSILTAGATKGMGGRGVTQVNNFKFAAPTSMKTQNQVANRTALLQRQSSRLV